MAIDKIAALSRTALFGGLEETQLRALSCALARLQQNGLIAVDGGRVTILNEEALTAYAE